MTSYNYEKYLPVAINSVINQTYQDWELIIVDDGSIDSSVEIIKFFCQKDKRIKLFQHENSENKGLKSSILLGIEHSTGEWIAFLESDDFFEFNHLSRKVEIINKYPSASLIFNKVKFLQENTHKNKLLKGFEKKQENLSKLTYPRNMFYDFYINNMILTFSCVMIKSKVLKNTDFNSPSDRLIDWWLWIHIAYKNNFYYLNEELTNWRLHDESYIVTGKKPMFLPIQVSAYKNVYEKNNHPRKLLYFRWISNIKLFFVLGFRFLRKLGGLFNK